MVGVERAVVEPTPKSGQRSAPERGRLPAGRHGLSAEFVVQSQRERTIIALARCAAERGYSETRIGDIVGVAGIARATFYEQFGSKESCFVAAFEFALERLRRRIIEALRSEEHFPDRVGGSLYGLLEFLGAEPELARLCLIEAPAVGRPAGHRYRRALDRFADLLRGCRPETPAARQLPESTEPVLVAGIVALLARRIEAGDGMRLGELHAELTELALGPYLGAAEATRIARGLASAPLAPSASPTSSAPPDLRSTSSPTR
jgi:AcrR family transcriptional regulator